MIRYVVRRRIGENNQRRISSHNSKLSALKEALQLLREQKYPMLYITKTEYASNQRLEQDFSVQESIIWSEWFHGEAMLHLMITRCNADAAYIAQIKTGKLIAMEPYWQYWLYADKLYSVNVDGTHFNVWCSVENLNKHLHRLYQVIDRHFFTDNPDFVIVDKEFLSQFAYA